MGYPVKNYVFEFGFECILNEAKYVNFEAVSCTRAEINSE